MVAYTSFNLGIHKIILSQGTKNSTQLTPRVFPCTLFHNHGYLLNVYPTKVLYKSWGVNQPDGTCNLVPLEKL